MRVDQDANVYVCAWIPTSSYGLLSYVSVFLG